MVSNHSPHSPSPPPPPPKLTGQLGVPNADFTDADHHLKGPPAQSAPHPITPQVTQVRRT